MSNQIKFLNISELREYVTFRLTVHNESVNTSFNAADLSIGVNSTLGTQRLSFKGVSSSLTGGLSLYSTTAAGTDDLMFSVGSGQTNMSLTSGIESDDGKNTGIYRLKSNGTITGNATLTFQKVHGFENIGRYRRKPGRPNPYPNS